jgi:hypothetical protein
MMILSIGFLVFLCIIILHFEIKIRRIFLMKRILILFSLTLLLILTLPLLEARDRVIISSDADAADMSTPAPGMQGKVGVSTKPSAETLNKGAAPNPPANAEKKTTAGGGKLSVNTANPKDGGDSFWVESIDVDGDGTVETASFIWDDEDKVTYIYAAKDFVCADGGIGNGDMLIVVYGKDNVYKKPAGSGWYAFSLGEGECGAKTAAVWGCEFDAKGNATDCGLAAIDEANDDILLVEEEMKK